MGELKAIAWACCYLEPQDPIYDTWSEIGDQLRDMGMQLVLFGIPGNYGKHSGFEHVAVPFSLTDQGRLFADFMAGEGLPLGAATLREMIAIDRAFGVTATDTEAELWVMRAIAFWERAFDLMQPSIILGWGTSIPLSRLMIRLGQRRQVPAYAMERGLLENTLSLSLGGQVALSSVSTSTALIRPPELDDVRLALWNQIESYYRQLATRRYALSNREPYPHEEQFMRDDPAPRVLFLGNYDIGSGCALTDPALGDHVSTWVASSEAASGHIVNKLRAINPHASLWSKPHPITPFGLPEDRAPLMARNVFAIDVHRLVQAADVLVTLTSTTQALALIYDRPLVTLANGFFMGRNIAYEVTSEDQLQSMLAAALARDGWSDRLQQGRALLVAMMQHDLFGVNDEVPTRLKIADLALLIGRFARYIKHGMAPAAVRLLAFTQFRTEAEGGRNVLIGHREALQAEAQALREQIAALGAERNAMYAQLRKVILDRARQVFDPSELNSAG